MVPTNQRSRKSPCDDHDESDDDGRILDKDKGDAKVIADQQRLLAIEGGPVRARADSGAQKREGGWGRGQNNGEPSQAKLLADEIICDAGKISLCIDFSSVLLGSAIDPTILSELKGLFTIFFFDRSNLIFWMVMGCGIADFVRRGLKTPQTQNVWVLIPLPVPNWASAEAQFIPNFSLSIQIFF